MKPYVVIEKKIGETPLSALEHYREKHTEFKDAPMAYAGRLDPMATGKLLILLGEECKVQEKYHNLDKEYIFEILFGVSSDTADVLGILKLGENTVPDRKVLEPILSSLIGEVSLPYPHFSSRTVKGKPLHTWTLEGRLDEIEIPVKKSHIFKLELLNTEQKTAETIYTEALEKVESIPRVTDESKALGRDFRRDDVRASWQLFSDTYSKNTFFTIATIRCVASSGTYMRTLASVIAERLGTRGLAYSIHRTKIGRYVPLPFNLGFWAKKF